jgi:hypothetical protein
MANKEEKSRTDKPQELVEAQSADASAKSETAPPGLEQVREILFGAFFRELERRLSRTDIHTSTRSKEIELEARRRADVLETHLQKDIEALASRVEHALREGSEALHVVERENRDAIGALEKRLSKAEEAAAGAQRDLRNQMLVEAKSFLDELQRLRKELISTFQGDMLARDTGSTEERRGDEERAKH